MIFRHLNMTPMSKRSHFLCTCHFMGLFAVFILCCVWMNCSNPFGAGVNFAALVLAPLGFSLTNLDVC